jgi:Domain of unknown function (DUF4266)
MQAHLVYLAEIACGNFSRHYSVGRRQKAWFLPAALALGLGLLLGGCSPIEPWVKPYEREHFADPIMSFNRDPVSGSYLEHVFESREGGRGATGGVGGGCGCN